MTLHGLREVERTPARSRMSAITKPMPSPAGRVIGLPTEFEWEVASRGSLEPRRLTSPIFYPGRHSSKGVSSLFGGVWEWTQSAYLPLSRL